MTFAVRFTKSAQIDLRGFHAYISKHDSMESADYVARQIVRAAMALRDLPERGAHPAELLQKGSRAYRQIFFKPYRILYRIRGNTLYVSVIADGRRDMTPLLARRLRSS